MENENTKMASRQSRSRAIPPGTEYTTRELFAWQRPRCGKISQRGLSDRCSLRHTDSVICLAADPNDLSRSAGGVIRLDWRVGHRQANIARGRKRGKRGARAIPILESTRIRSRQRSAAQGVARPAASVIHTAPMGHEGGRETSYQMYYCLPDNRADAGAAAGNLPQVERGMKLR